uniref:Transporter n=1 Tax=Globodera rostochiensis TaxID=31243 RepID=A0A914HN92_GLORO
MIFNFHFSIGCPALRFPQKRRKAQLERNWRIPEEKMQELGLFLVELNRQLEGNDFEGAAVIYIKCLAFVEELERLYPNKLIQPIVLAPSNIIPPPHPANFAVLEATKLDSNAPDVATFRPNRFLHFAGKPPERGGSRGRNGVNRRSLWNRITDRGMRKLRDQTSGARADEVRDLWNTQIEFFLSCLGFIVGGGNTLRFPAMIFEFGGIFFIPHLFFMVIFGFPLVYMHLAIGQYSGLSASAAFYKMMPIASGLGWALVLLALPVSIYYIFYVAWGFYYLWFALHGIFEQDGMIWEHCRPEWVLHFNCCELTTMVNGERCGGYGGQAMPAPEAFFYFQVLNRTMDVQEAGLGQIQEHLLISLIISWIVVFFGVFKGLGSIGWAVSITATLPYFLLVILLLRSISLEGASTGLVYLFKPELKNLWNLKLWRKAAEQVFYSLGIDAGPLISMASFSRYRNNIYRDAVLMVIIDTLTSVLCGMVIFSFIGFMTTQQGIRIQDIQRLDPSYIAFTVYPGVTSYLEWGFVWAILFYIILTVSALDAEFAWLEMIAASIMNKFGSKQKRLENRLLIILCVFCFLCGIPLCTQGGIYIFHAIENMNSNWNSFSLSLIQVLIVCHAYGVDKFLEDIADMLRVDRLPSFDVLSSREHFLWRRFLHVVGPTGAYIKWMWSMFAPIVLTLLLIASILGYERVTFNGIKLPIEYELIAWIVMIGPLLIVPVTALYNIWDAKRSNKPLKSVFSGSFRKRELDEEESKQPKHTQQNEGGLYAYIDPLSRGASAKSATNRFSRRSATIFWHKDNQQQQNLAADDEQKYQEVRERLRRWTEEEGSSSIGVQRSLTDRPEIEDDSVEETEDGTEDQRMPGRISDWQRAQQHQQVINNALFTPQDMAMQSFGMHHIQRKDTESATDTQSQSKCESPFLFGPPPQQPVLLGTYTNNKTDIVDDSHNEAGTSDNIKITSQSIVKQFGQSSSVIELSEFSTGLAASAGVVVPCQQHQQPFPFSLSMHSQPDWRTSNLTRQRLKRPQPIAQRMMKKKE